MISTANIFLCLDEIERSDFSVFCVKTVHFTGLKSIYLVTVPQLLSAGDLPAV